MFVLRETVDDIEWPGTWYVLRCCVPSFAALGFWVDTVDEINPALPRIRNIP